MGNCYYHVLIEVHCCSGKRSSDKLSFVELKITMILAHIVATVSGLTLS